MRIGSLVQLNRAAAPYVANDHFIWECVGLILAIDKNFYRRELSNNVHQEVDRCYVFWGHDRLQASYEPVNALIELL